MRADRGSTRCGEVLLPERILLRQRIIGPPIAGRSGLALLRALYRRPAPGCGALPRRRGTLSRRGTRSCGALPCGRFRRLLLPSLCSAPSRVLASDERDVGHPGHDISRPLGQAPGGAVKLPLQRSDRPTERFGGTNQQRLVVAGPVTLLPRRKHSFTLGHSKLLLVGRLPSANLISKLRAKTLSPRERVPALSD